MDAVLLQNVLIFNSTSPAYGLRKDIQIKHGKITAVAEAGTLPAEGFRLISGDGLAVSPGWLDLRARCGEPGHESSETLQSLCAAAAAGGFTNVCLMPDTKPAAQTRDAIHFIKNYRAEVPVSLHAVAAASADTAGEEMSELMDLHQAGAIAFSDGRQPIYKTNLIKKILLYLKQFNALFINLPDERSLSEGGQMHEGIQSTLLGMKGIPDLAEKMGMQRDLELLRYTEGRIHFSCLSTTESIALLRQAQTEGLKASGDIATYQLAFTDDDLATFDTFLKVKPPLRSAETQQTLWRAIAEGTIRVLVSNHIPVDSEGKNLEFDLADFGMINLQTAFAAANTSRPDFCSLSTLVACFAEGPYQLLGLPVPSLEEGAEACLTVFAPEADFNFTSASIRSLSRNSPFTGKALKGLVRGIYAKGRWAEASA